MIHIVIFYQSNRFLGNILKEMSVTVKSKILKLLTVITLMTVSLFIPLNLISTKAATTFSLIVNGKSIPSSQGQPFERDGITYVPLKAVVQQMGDKYSFNEPYRTATIRQKNGQVVTLTNGKTVAIVNGKTVPLTTKTVGKNKTVVPAGHRSTMINGILYVPTEFVQKGLKYPVKVQKSTFKTVVYVGGNTQTSNGTQQNNTQSSKNETANPSNKQVNTSVLPAGYSLPAGWIPPTIKTTATNDPAKNIQILSDQLGFYKTWKCGAIFNPYIKAFGPYSIMVSQDPARSYDVYIQIEAWVSSYNIEYNKTPYIVKELFKFYGIDRIYDIVKAGFEGKDIRDKMNRILKVGNREVKIVGVGDYAVIYVSAPGQKLVIK
ncbi:MAG: hypothetical protein CW346_09795 [Bacillaceae bacterium]|nr:hypothetical protein [Bacillaceae bacterium]